MFQLFKEMAEKLSSCHMDIVQKLHDIIKDLSKYLDKQKSEHKLVSYPSVPTYKINIFNVFVNLSQCTVILILC